MITFTPDSSNLPPFSEQATRFDVVTCVLSLSGPVVARQPPESPATRDPSGECAAPRTSRQRRRREASEKAAQSAAIGLLKLSATWNASRSSAMQQPRTAPNQAVPRWGGM
ncbi:MAG: hypothetical protein K0Q46_6677 [Rhodococcus erythropolis]|nr:hypothetical protein [Rhodococcus erythropolis]